MPPPAQAQEVATTTSPIVDEAPPAKMLPDDEQAISLAIDYYAADLTPAERTTLKAISRCESFYNQFDDDGGPLYNPSHYAVGAMQIALLHIPAATKAGYDIEHSLADNVHFGVELYKAVGTGPWDSSKRCWNKAAPGW